jgi:hypothetical protein
MAIKPPNPYAIMNMYNQFGIVVISNNPRNVYSSSPSNPNDQYKILK